MVHLGSMPIYALNEEPVFPDPEEAEADGLLAVGGDLSPPRVLAAYALGIFPWPISNMPLTWFAPPRRMILRFADIRVSRSLRQTIRREGFRLSMDEAFDDVVRACAGAPRGDAGTWITSEMQAAYAEIHELGFAHSVEVWRNDELVGGLYGISIGTMFCGESMFHRESNASKVAFVTLARQLERWEFDFLDCQLHTPHLASLGAAEIPRAEFSELLRAAVWRTTRRGKWRLELGCEDLMGH